MSKSSDKAKKNQGLHIDAWIMEVIEIDDLRWRKLRMNTTQMVGTGLWKLWEDENGAYISFTDDYSDEVKDVVIMEDCNLVEGDRLVYFTNVHYDGSNYGLVLFKESVYTQTEEK